MGRTVQIVFDAADTVRIGDFWADALGYVVEPPPPGFDSWPDALRAWKVPEEDWDTKNAIVDPDGIGPRIFLQKVPEAKSVKNRLHLDIRVSDPAASPEERDAAVLAEVGRLEAAGGRRLEWRLEMGKHFMVMQDPEGNEFCVT
ncbi:VOC family protein [Angustibacter sp. McL0619]|uniref:VOC family protein n=1 Tax=Angustibacter sp. McL0619 TaxID=3415676 RepID=UPI003CF80A9D